jgi:hypothetical protein
VCGHARLTLGDLYRVAYKTMLKALGFLAKVPRGNYFSI